MVGPGRGPDQHPGARVGRGDQLERQRQRTAPARSLQPLDRVVAGVPTKHDRTQGSGVSFVPRTAEIGLGLLRFPQPLLGFLERARDRGRATAVAIDPDPDVDLVGTRIGIGQRDQREQRIRFDRGEGFKHPGIAVNRLGMGMIKHDPYLAFAARRAKLTRRNRPRRPHRPGLTGRSGHSLRRLRHR